MQPDTLGFDMDLIDDSIDDGIPDTWTLALGLMHQVTKTLVEKDLEIKSADLELAAAEAKKAEFTSYCATYTATKQAYEETEGFCRAVLEQFEGSQGWAKTYMKLIKLMKVAPQSTIISYDRIGDGSTLGLSVKGRRIGVLSRDDATVLNAYRCTVRRCDALIDLDDDLKPDGSPQTKYTHREKVYTEPVFEKHAEDLTRNLIVLIRQAQIDSCPS